MERDMITALSYVVVDSPAFDAWSVLARTLVGLHEDVVEAGQRSRLRMDGKVQRLLLQRSTGVARFTMGFEVAGGEALQALAQRLAACGIALTPGTDEELAHRGVEQMQHFVDPDGNRVELAVGLADTDAPFIPGRPTGGFRTGDLGMGHVALKCGNFDAMCKLYRDPLGFKLSDRASSPFAVEFLHVNARHHTVGLADTGTGAGLYHLMLEYNDWDDVGRALDIALEKPESIGVSLGRHLNDHVTSFYLTTPDGWLLEFGWAGRLIGDDWQPSELPGLSFWGHDRTWLPPAKRAQAKALLQELSARGVRAPVVPGKQSGE
jgi:2,3-dihydroxybiphenyl 1,2-dioxygenase